MKVKPALECFKQFHKNDPREFLNYYFWSVLVKYQNRVAYDHGWCKDQFEKYDDWCNEQFDPEDYVRIGNKIWFTNQSQYFHFRLTWEDDLDKSLEGLNES